MDPKNNVSHIYVTDSASDKLSIKDFIFKLKDFINYLLNEWKLLISVAVIGAVVGYIYAHSKKATYTAITTFVLEDNEKTGGGLLGQYSGIASMAGIDLSGGGGGLFQGENIIELYKSRLMLQKALLTPDRSSGGHKLLIDRYFYIKVKENANKNRMPKKPSFEPSQGKELNRLQDSVLGKVVEDINKTILTVTKPDKKSSIIQVSVKFEDESFAKDFNDQIVKTVNDFYIQTKTKKTLENLSILQHQTDSVRTVLNGSIYKSVGVGDATPNLNPTRQILRVPVQQYQVNAEANRAILAQLIQNLELAKITLRKETPLIQVIDTPIYPLEKDKLSTFTAIVAGTFLITIITILILSVTKALKPTLPKKNNSSVITG